ncbi:hypothetical protein PAE9249_01020 [Paenibacillus sp. CECT 9249]|nr:hypothetical protein PAE9249_01020 [Paenibacillus sp. CECT 9249]
MQLVHGECDRFERLGDILSKSILFLIIAFAISWLLWAPALLSSVGAIKIILPTEPFVVLGAFGPSFASILLSYLYEGKQGVMDLLRKAARFKVRVGWHLLALLLLPLLFVLAYGVYYLAHGKFYTSELISEPRLIVPFFIYSLLLGGSLQQEFGWRGYLLPRLQRKWSALRSSLVLGLLWSVWHVPLSFISGTIQSYIPFWLFAAAIVALSVLFAWLYNNAGESLWITILFHTLLVLSFSGFPLIDMEKDGSYAGFLYFTIALWITAGIVALTYGSNLVRAQTGRTAKDLAG